MRFALMLALGLCCAGSGAQEISLGQQRPAVTQRIVLLTDSLDVEAGKPQAVELRFRVEPGFHINSHTPMDETLIPTELRVDSADGLQAQTAGYPAGETFRLKLGAGMKLDVYEGEFRVTVRLTARKGASLLVGGLRYQACDNASCFPPRTLPVRVAIAGR